MSLNDTDHGHEIIRRRLELLKAITAIPTATGREHRVVAFIREWVGRRPELRLEADAAGNLVVSFKAQGRTLARSRKAAAGHAAQHAPPLFITAHLDHPAFVVERVDPAAMKIELSFRGGVNEVFFEHAPVSFHTSTGIVAGTLTGPAPTSSPAGKHFFADLDQPSRAAFPAVGDIATWAMPGSEIDARGILHAPACDDLAAAAAALSAMEALCEPADSNGRRHAAPRPDVRLLFTLAEEIGFIGAIAACRLKTIPRGSVVIALENSRAFPESPIGAGPVVRVGDRLSIFTPWVTAACARRAEATFGGASAPSASQTLGQAAARPWQRRLMSGGACEASVFCHAGYDATCLCLALGNYHNMPHLDKLQAGTYDATQLGPPRCEREFIHTEDYLGLVDLLIALGRNPPRHNAGEKAEFEKRVQTLYLEKSYVLPAQVAPRPRPPARRAKARAVRPVRSARSTRSAKRAK